MNLNLIPKNKKIYGTYDKGHEIFEPVKKVWPQQEGIKIIYYLIYFGNQKFKNY
jgi:hypothetical protein